MNQRTCRILSMVCALGLLLSMLAGCSKAPEAEVPAAVESPAQSGSTEAVSTAAPEDKFVELNVGFIIGWDSLTPFRTTVSGNAPYVVLLYESLAALTGEHTYAPWVAKSWETSDNGYTYSVEIWDNVTDSAGNHITAADIVWFIQKSMDAALKPIFAKVESVTQTGEYTLEVKLHKNLIGTMENVLKDTFVISKAAFEASADEFATSVVSTSPYICKDYTAGVGMTFEKRADYWQDTELLPACVRPMVDKITYKIIPEASQMGIALETGDIDIAVDIPSTTGAQFLGNNQFTVQMTEGVQGYQLFFSGADNSPCADNVLLRQAICYAIDSNGMIQGLCSGYGSQMSDVCPSAMIGFNEKWKSEDYYSYNLEKAKQLLAESGYNGEELVLLAPPYALMPRAAEMLQSYMTSAGINCKINSVDMALFTSMRLDGTQYDMVIHSIGGTYMSDHWAKCYDPAAYSTGDATSRHDAVLAELLYKTWTAEGWTEENIDSVHYYLKDNAIAYGFIDPNIFTIWNNDIGLESQVLEFAGYIAPAACTYTGK